MHTYTLANSICDGTTTHLLSMLCILIEILPCAHAKGNKDIDIIIIIIIDNVCIALFSGVPKLTALYNILQHFLSFTNIIDIIMTTNNV